MFLLRAGLCTRIRLPSECALSSVQDKTPIPVILLTGFLGSGKTTLANRLVRDPAWRDALVVLNEFGDVPLDHLLVAHSAETLVVGLGGGCLCCTVRGDLVQTLTNLPWRFSRGGRRQFSKVLIETSGLADPAPILQTLTQHPKLAGRYRLEGVATVVDLLRGADNLARHVEARRQAALADLLLLTKGDLVTPQQRQALHEQLDSINAHAPRRELQREGHDEDGLAMLLMDLSAGLTTRRSASLAVHGELKPGHINAAPKAPRHCGGEAPAPGPESFTAPGGSAKEGACWTPAPAVHGEGVQAFSFTLDIPLPPARVRSWMAEVSKNLGEQLLRVKGLVRLADDGGLWALHGVGRHWSTLERAPDQPLLDTRSRLVFIVEGVDRDVLARLVGQLTSTDS